jgi:iron complex outermembrane recepter protein
MTARQVVALLIRESRAAPLASLLGLTLAAGISPVMAADAAATSSTATSLEEVVVTGTSIKRADAETALPVQVLKQEDIARTGATTVEELARQLSAVSSSGSASTAQQTGFQQGAISTISLRGLGSGRTLVLINGRRMSVYGGGSVGIAGSSVDISAIPISAIERVEILKDGASALYGSDAIGGVVNFILRSDFQGLQASATGGSPTRAGGGAEETVSIYGGTGDLKSDRFNITGGIDFNHVGQIMGSSRAFATRYDPGYGNDVTSSFAFPANVSVPGKGISNPLAGNCGPDSLNDKFYPNQCRFDNSPFDSVQPEQKRFSGNLSGSFAVTDTNKIYAEALFSEVTTETVVQPVPLAYTNPLLPGNPYIPYLANLLATQYPGYTAVTPGEGAFLLPPNSPYYPTAFATAHGINGQPLNLIYRDFANGLRQTEDIAATSRAVLGYKGSSGGWDYDTAFLYSQVKVHEDLQSGYALYSKIMPLLDTGVINPFGPTTDPTALAAANAAQFIGQSFASKTSVTSLNGTATRDLLTLPAGALKGAAGAEIRRETFEYDPSVGLQTGDISGEGGNQLPESKARNVESAYIELNAPVVTGLELDGAVRYDNYQRVGSTVNPKGSVRWQPEPWVVLRGSAGTGFRAPSLTDLYSSQATSVTGNGTRDPIKCPTPDPNNTACSFQFTTVTGGNPNLKPEKSDNFTLGTVLQPTGDLTITVDAFWIFLKDAITAGGLPYAFILQNAQTATQYANLITRDANGNIISIEQTNANLFKINVSGIDIDLLQTFRVGDTGHLSLHGNGTYFGKYATQNANGTWTGQLDQGLNGINGVAGGIVSRWRHTVTALYGTDIWNVSLTHNFQKKYHDSASSITLLPREVSAYSTVDGQFAYTGLKSLEFDLGVKNLFNANPPYANYAAQVNNFIGGYDASYGDPRGRFVYATVKYSL